MVQTCSTEILFLKEIVPKDLSVNCSDIAGFIFEESLDVMGRSLLQRVTDVDDSIQVEHFTSDSFSMKIF